MARRRGIGEGNALIGSEGRHRPGVLAAAVAALSMAIGGITLPAMAADGDASVEIESTDRFCEAFDLTKTDFGPDRTEEWPVLSLQKFDPALGDYVRTELVYKAEGVSNYGMRVFGNGPRDVTMTNDLTMTLEHAGEAQLKLEHVFDTGPVRVTGLYATKDDVPEPSPVGEESPIGHPFYAAADAVEGELTTSATSGVVTSTDATLWVGSGVNRVDVRAEGESRTSGAGNMAYYSVMRVGGEACVQHFYAPAAGESEMPEEVLTDWVCEAREPRLTDFNVSDGTGEHFFIPRFGETGLPGAFARVELIQSAELVTSGHVEFRHKGLADIHFKNTYRIWTNLPPNEPTASPMGDSDNELYGEDSAVVLDLEDQAAGTVDIAGTRVDISASRTSSEASVWDGMGSHEVALQTMTSMSQRGGGGNFSSRLRTTAAAGVCYRYAYIPEGGSEPVDPKPIDPKPADPEPLRPEKPKAPKVSIGDRVWVDADSDGVQGRGEGPVAGVTVALLDADGDQIGTALTDPDGYYAFTDLDPKTDYTVVFPASVTVDGDEYVLSDARRGGDGSLDSDPSAEGEVRVTTPAEGSNVGERDRADDPTIDAGYRPISILPIAPEDPVLVSVGDRVWVDVNRDGAQSEGEPSAPGIIVNLYDADGGLVSTTETDDEGFYSFIDLIPDVEYVVEFVRDPSFSFTRPNVGSDPAADSDVDVETGRVKIVTPPVGDNNATNPDDSTIDAGLVGFNLSIKKVLVTEGVIEAGDVVEFLLTPHNDGPADALGGWAITDLLPRGLTLTSVSGEGYTCDIAKAECLNQHPLKAGTDGQPITLTAMVEFDAEDSLRNIAYIAPSPEDVAEGIPLKIPTNDTDTEESMTDNDDQALVMVVGVPDDGEFPDLPDTFGPFQGPDASLADTGASTFGLWVAIAMVVTGGGFIAIRRKPIDN